MIAIGSELVRTPEITDSGAFPKTVVPVHIAIVFAVPVPVIADMPPQATQPVV